MILFSFFYIKCISTGYIVLILQVNTNRDFCLGCANLSRAQAFFPLKFLTNCFSKCFSMINCIFMIFFCFLLDVMEQIFIFVLVAFDGEILYLQRSFLNFSL